MDVKNTMLNKINQTEKYKYCMILITCGMENMEKEMATHSSILAWRIPWTKEPGRLQSWSQTGLSD